MVESSFSALLGYLCWRCYAGENRFVLPAAIALGVAAGFRQSTLVVLAPLLWFSIRRVPPGWRLTGIGALGLTMFAWSMPMVRAGGGAHAYFSSLWSLWRLVPAKQTILTSSIFTSLARLGLIASICVFSFGPVVFLFLSPWRAPNRRIHAFTWMWLTPALVLFTFVYLKLVNSGYLLVLLPPACVRLGYLAAQWHSHSTLPHIVRVAALAAVAAIDCSIFFRAPLYFSYREVQRSQAEVAAVQASIRQLARPDETIIVGFDSHFSGYRHAGYYLPEYLTLQFPEVPLASTAGVFAMRARNTRLVSRIQVGSFREFIVFPLPSSDDEYLSYMQAVQARFPAGALNKVISNGREFLTGPVSALPLLFPNSIGFEQGAP
jgi:hypothetical protein